MKKLKGSAAEKILKKAGGVFGDKGFIGTDYITTPIRKLKCRELLQWEHEWNNQVSSYRAPVERAVATLKTWRILFTDYRRPLRPSSRHFAPQSGFTFSRRVLHNPHSLDQTLIIFCQKPRARRRVLQYRVATSTSHAKYHAPQALREKADVS